MTIQEMGAAGELIGGIAVIFILNMSTPGPISYSVEFAEQDRSE